MQEIKIPFETASRPKLIAIKNNAALIMTPKLMARITMSRHAGLATSPTSCNTGKVSRAMAMAKMGAPIPTMKPINKSIRLLSFKIPLV